MFGLDPKAMAEVKKIAEEQKKMTAALENVAVLLPQMITELKRLNENLEKK